MSETTTPPIMVEVWCFDCPRIVFRTLRGLFPQPTIPQSLVAGAPLYEWCTWREKPGDPPRPEAFTRPGVYAKMSDGTWRRL